MKNGFGIVQALIGSLIMSIVALATYGLITNSNLFSVKIDRESRVDQTLIKAAYEIKKLEFDAIYNNICTENARTSVDGHAGNCRLANGMLNEGTETSGPGVLGILGTRLTWDGVRGDQGKVCVEVQRCELRAGGRMANITLRAYFASPKSNEAALMRSLVFRKAR